MRYTETDEELFRLSFDVTINEPRCEELTIVHDYHDSFDGPVLADMEITVEADASGNPLSVEDRIGWTEEQDLPPLLDEFGLF